MNKTELIEAIAKEASLSKKDAEAALNAYTSVVTKTLKKGDKISQLVIVPVVIPPLEIVDELEDTERGDGGFGSTGR